MMYNLKFFYLPYELIPHIYHLTPSLPSTLLSSSSPLFTVSPAFFRRMNPLASACNTSTFRYLNLNTYSAQS